MKNIPYALGHRVLVADDNPSLQKIISTNLELAGYEVGTVSDGREALAVIERNVPDFCCST